MIVLVGFMGAGKTTTGRALAGHLGLPFVDTDELIAARAGRPVPEVFARDGEAAFRALEREVVAEVLSGRAAVVALGAGALNDEGTRAALEGATVVHLRVSFEQALARVGGDEGRPMLRLADPFVLYEERRLLYEDACDLAVDTDLRSPEEVAEELAARLGAPPGGVRRIVVGRPEESYDVIVGRGLVARLAQLVARPSDAERAFVVTQPGVEEHADAVTAALAGAGLTVAGSDVPAGDAAKTVAEAERLWGWLADLGATRHDLVVAVGGGAVTDLAGFVAATYARGLALINVPTTLLGQVDAAIGGKTAINLPQGKNLVGAFHRPVGVVCDVATLKSLPEPELRAGLAEVAKYGFIAEPDLLEFLTANVDAIVARDPAVLTEVVARSVAIKAAFVAADEREANVRAHLNYGHTFAHAIEQAAGFSGVRHGEAVALGMMAAAYLAHELGRIGPEVVDRHRTVLRALGLPVAAVLEAGALEGAWRRDKKYRRGVRFVLLAGLGRPEAGIQAPRAAIDKALARMAPENSRRPS